MRDKLAVIAAISAAVVCWGVYGPVLHWGEMAMGGAGRLRPFLGVGVAYFLIAVVAPSVLLWINGETGAWTASGIFWSLAAGAAGAIGALGVIMAFGAGGRPIYVMPLVFGGAPVVNTALTMTVAKTVKRVGPAFLAGLIMVVLGAVFVLVFRTNTRAEGAGESFHIMDFLWVMLSVAVVVACWGAYGPVLHRGQLKMHGSRLRPFICVGLAYFAIGVVVPALLLSAGAEPGQFTMSGTFWSLLAGTAGALGALGIILAFTFGGKPIYVMPLVFGGAPVVNTFLTMMASGEGAPSPFFYAGLILVITGAAMVLVFSPTSSPHAEKSEPQSPNLVESAPNAAQPFQADKSR
jgi:hypothetical protein